MRCAPQSLDENRRRRLAQLRARLVAVSMRSRSLRLTRTTRTGALDLRRLADVDAAAFDRLLGMLGREGAAPVALCDVEPTRDARELAADIAMIAHAAEATWSETGTRELAIGWPFVEGRTNDGTWIRAPLLLYPVKLAMSSKGRLSWMLEPLGPPELNESLVHALVRLASVRLDLDGLLAHDDDRRLCVDGPTWAAFVAYLTSVGLVVDAPSELPPLEPLEARLREDRERAPIGRLELRPHLVLGRFPRSDSSIIADYDELLDARRTEPLDEARLGLAARLLEVDERAAASEATEHAGVAARGSAETRATTDPSSLAWRVFPSDDSQDEALRLLAEGPVVVQGPPGTGKSQMIANLLASAIAEGKRVLVVCQKRAALDVVAARLASVGLREPVAVVHDPQIDRAEVCAAIGKTLESLGERDAGGRSRVAAEIEERTREHSRALSRLSARLETAQRAYATLAGDGSRPGLAALLERSLDDDGRPLPDLGDLASEATEDAAHAILPTIELLARETAALAAPHPLAHRTDWSGRTKKDLDDVFARVRVLRDVVDALAALPEGSMTPRDAAARKELWDETSVLLDVLEANDTEQLRAFLLGWVWTGGHVAHGEWRRIMETLRRARKELEEAPPELVLEKRERLETWIAELETLERLEGLWYRVFLPSWWSLRKRPDEILARCASLTALARPGGAGQRKATAVRALCERAIPWQKLIEQLPVDNALFDFGLRGELSDLDDAIRSLETHHARTRAVHRLASELAYVGGPYASMPAIAEQAPETLAQERFFAAAVTDRRRGKLFAKLKDSVRALEGDFEKAYLERIVEKAGSGDVEGARSLVRALADVEPEAAEAVRLDERTRELPAWARAFLRGWRPSADGKHTAGDDALLSLERAWIALARRGESAARIEAPLVEPDLLDQLSRDLETCLEAAGRGVLARWRRRVMEALADRRRGVSLRKLAAEVAKKRNRATMRQLVERHWDEGLSDVRPIWFCSPEAVASLFPLRADTFDLVVLDEASQCPVEAALPTLARARVALVAGDDQQMPPAHFFRASADEDARLSSADDDDDEVEELTVLATESILGLARVAFPGTVLRWHYRSRHEELVAFSNAAFYGRRLITAPRAEERERFEGSFWVRVDGTWRNQTNEVEAARVVDIVAELLSAADPPSVGVIAFNKKQADLVERLLDRRLTEDESFRAAFERDRTRSVVEQLFVRNLENVQGDERDVVVLSLAYGPSERGGRVHARFGPLGVEGGEKRLNVAITRARRGLVVVTSFEPEELDTSGSKHVGPKLLRTYLEFVRAQARGEDIEPMLARASELGGGKGVTGAGPEASSRRRVGQRIADELQVALENRGLRTKRGVGLGYHRLDLAVGRPGEERWRLGVDCTGFLDEPDALSRDVYGPRFWERVGWRVLRVSPGTWLETRDGVLDRITQMVYDSAARERPVAGASVRHPEPAVLASDGRPNPTTMGSA